MLPGDPYDGPDPWGAITHHELVAYLEGYVDRHRLPVRTGVAVEQLNREDGTYRVTTDGEMLLARTVVIATGNQSRQVRPPWSSDLPAAVRQVDFSAYRNPAELAYGAVLVVGSGQSGGQIAEDLVRPDVGYSWRPAGLAAWYVAIAAAIVQLAHRFRLCRCPAPGAHPETADCRRARCSGRPTRSACNR